jgi:hypothetical protein
MVERASCLLGRQLHRDARRSRKVDVHPSIAVVVDQRHSAAHGFDDVLLLRARQVFEANARRHSDVHKLRHGQRRRGWRTRSAMNARIRLSPKHPPAHWKSDAGSACKRNHQKRPGGSAQSHPHTHLLFRFDLRTPHRWINPPQAITFKSYPVNALFSRSRIVHSRFVPQRRAHRSNPCQVPFCATPFRQGRQASAVPSS